MKSSNPPNYPQVAVPAHIMFFEQPAVAGESAISTIYSYYPLVPVPINVTTHQQLKDFERATFGCIGNFVHHSGGILLEIAPGAALSEKNGFAERGFTHVLITGIEGGRRRTYYKNLLEIRTSENRD